MAILKAPPTQPTNETLQLRVSQDLKFRLTRYAEFIHATASYVVSEALERLFRKDAEFQKYLATYTPPESENHNEADKPIKSPLKSPAK
jgi:predicted transcriptional regulator